MNDVSVILLTTGEETTLRAVESLKKQTLKPVETIIIENVTPFIMQLMQESEELKLTIFSK